MNRVYRSKTQPVKHKSREPLTSFRTSLPRYNPEQDHKEAAKTNFKLPKINLGINQIEKQMINKRILRLKRNGYNPVGCSKSVRLEKVLLRKKINKKSLLQKYEQINPSILSYLSK